MIDTLWIILYILIGILVSAILYVITFATVAMIHDIRMINRREKDDN